MNNYNAMVRGIVQNNDKDATVANVKRCKIYPYGERDNPKPNKFGTMSDVAADTLPPQGMEYWARLSAFINNNPVAERDRFYMAMLSRSASRKANRSSPTRGSVPSSKTQPGSVTRWAA